MAAPTGSLFDTHKDRIEERLGKTVNLFLQQADPVWREMIASSQGVVPIDEFSRHYQVHHIYQNAVGGVFESGAPRNDFGLFGDVNNQAYGAKLYTANSTQTFPDAKEDPGALTYRLTIPMRTILTNMRLLMEELRAEATPAFIGKVIAPRMLAWARGLQRRLCSSWYVSQAENYRLSTLGPSSSTGAYAIDTTNKNITFYPPHKATGRFAVGDRVDVFKDVSSVPTRLNDTQGTAANQTLTTRIKGFVSSVNKMTNQVVIQFDTTDSTFGTWATTSNIGSSAYVVWANSTVAGAAFKDIAGLSSWMKFGDGTSAGNRLLGAEAEGSVNTGIIDVTVHPEFRSFLKAVNGVLTEHKLNLYLDRVTEAIEDEGEYLDTLVTTSGVIRAAMLQKEGRQILDRTGRLSSLADQGEDGKGMIHHHDGREYLVTTSTWQQAGVLDGYRRTNNWVRAIPPRLPNAGSMSGVDSAIPLELVVPTLTGTSSTVFPVLSSGNLTTMSQMPGHVAIQVYPKNQVRGMRLTGLTEDRVLSD